MARDLWRSERRIPKGGGTWVEWWGQDSVCRNWVNVQRHPSARLMCTETPYLHSLCLEMPGVWTREENLIRNRKKRGRRRRRRNPSVKICASCIKNAGQAWFQFKERKDVAALWFCLECKQGFKGALFRWMFTFGLWNLGSLTVGDIQPTQAVHEWHEPGVAAGFSCTFSSATCTNQTRKHLKGTEKRAPWIF